MAHHCAAAYQLRNTDINSWGLFSWCTYITQSWTVCGRIIYFCQLSELHLREMIAFCSWTQNASLFGNRNLMTTSPIAESLSYALLFLPNRFSEQYETLNVQFTIQQHSRKSRRMTALSSTPNSRRDFICLSLVVGLLSHWISMTSFHGLNLCLRVINIIPQIWKKK